jgi:hypothetical protein
MNAGALGQAILLVLLPVAVAAQGLVALPQAPPDRTLPAACNDDDDDDAVPSRTTRAGGLPAVRLSAEEQLRTGIVVQTMTAASHRSELQAQGRVVDLQPLLDSRAATLTARADLAAAQAAAQVSGKAAERLRILHGEDSNVSARQLLEAEAQAAADAARRTGTELRLNDLEARAVQQWGAVLAGMALDPSSVEFAYLVAQRELLVLVTLFPGDALPEPAQSIQVAQAGQRDSARPATLIGAAPQTGALAQGETWYYRTAADRLRIGMRLDAWLPRAASAAAGVLLPDSAPLWHAGRLWVYVRIAPGLFVRRLLERAEEVRGGWFVPEGVAAGDSVVVRGAQLLYAEEFRSTIPSEDEARE